jgi:hypothetical protein
MSYITNGSGAINGFSATYLTAYVPWSFVSWYSPFSKYWIYNSSYIIQYIGEENFLNKKLTWVINQFYNSCTKYIFRYLSSQINQIKINTGSMHIIRVL